MFVVHDGRESTTSILTNRIKGRREGRKEGKKEELRGGGGQAAHRYSYPSHHHEGMWIYLAVFRPYDFELSVDCFSRLLFPGPSFLVYQFLAGVFSVQFFTPVISFVRMFFFLLVVAC